MAYRVLEPLWSPNYTEQYNPAVGITIHHAAGTSFEAIGRTFQSPARQASAHWGVDAGVAQQYVPEDRVAWHAGDWWANCNTIGIETTNCSGDPEWGISEATFQTLCELVADIAKRHGMGKLAVGKNIWGHRDFSSTWCPGHLYPRLQEIADRANAINNGEGDDELKAINIPKGGADVYRLYEPKSGEHMFTTDIAEKKHLTSLGWKDEGIAWHSPDCGQVAYRMYNPSGQHFWTVDFKEAEHLQKAGWIYEGANFASGRSGTPVFRLYNPNGGDHMFTTDAKEKDHLMKAGWKFEGTAFYAC